MIHRIGIFICNNKINLFQLRNKKLEDISYKGSFENIIETSDESLIKILKWIEERFEIEKNDKLDILVISDNKEYINTILCIFSHCKFSETKFTKEIFYFILSKKLKDSTYSFNFDFNKITIKKFGNTYKKIENSNKNLEKLFLFSSHEEFFNILNEIKIDKTVVKDEVKKGSMKEYCLIKTRSYQNK